ncbi:hypothetical protein GCM10010172_29240 [Paractinoplanes ferrugineus]|uniref:KAP NTPase domain-containing protein n=2 Tax=Paractinoplanes ferrugineus TaxID=113564 RepID=A0A919J089_9ACTN|nr:hypothetical protein Afe05nite_00060 [Actinoplanes ferrugineus]
MKAKDAREKLGKYTEAVAPLGTLGALFGLNAAPAMQKIGELLKGDVSADALRIQLEDSLKKLGQKVLVIVDDLDRLDPIDLLLVLKLIRLVGRLPNVFYLLAYDERTLIDVLRRSDLAWNEPGRARSYLEKIIQVRLDLPEVHPREIEEMVDAGFSALSAGHKVALTGSDQSRLGSSYVKVMRRYLSTPRAINKYFAQINATYPLVEGHVNFIDFALVSFLRTFESSVYRMIWENRDNFIRTDRHRIPRAKPEPSESLVYWRNKIIECGITEDSTQPMLDFLKMLFPAFGSTLTDNGSFIDTEGLEARHSVGSEHHFDRYFQFGISKFDLPDATIINALAEIDTQRPAENAALLGNMFEVSSTSAITKTSRLVQAHRPSRPGLLVDYLSEIYPKLDNTFNLTNISSKISLRQLVFSILDYIADEVKLRQALSDISSNEATFLLLEISRMISKSGEEITWGSTLVSNVLLRAMTLARATESVPFEQVDKRVLQLVRFWHQHEPDRCRSWIWSPINDGTWPLTELLVCLVQEAVMMSADASRTIAGFDTEFVTQILGLDEVVSALGENLTEAELPENFEDIWNPSAELKKDYAIRKIIDLSHVHGSADLAPIEEPPEVQLDSGEIPDNPHR